jgi:hypothetical protein
VQDVHLPLHIHGLGPRGTPSDHLQNNMSSGQRRREGRRTE